MPECIGRVTFDEITERIAIMKNKGSRVCAVTGGASGIGLSIAEYLCGNGYKVGVVDLKVDSLYSHFKNELDSKNIVAAKADITSQKEVENAFDAIRNDLGGVDVLINSAGVLVMKNFLDENENDWDRVVNVNLKGAYLCCKAVVPGMIKNNFGRIVSISSISGLKQAVFSSTAYCASKAGIIGFSRCLAAQLAGNNIRVNCVAPSTTLTPMIDALDEKTKNDYKKAVPLGRLAKPEDIVYAVDFLISDRSDYITGETLNVNGGLLMR
jgi:3-oxoacyl-[acyl-carrier protein] reductase